MPEEIVTSSAEETTAWGREFASKLVAPVLVSKSDLISTGPERLARRLATVYPLRLLPPPLPLPHFTFSIAWHPRFESDPAHVWFRQIVARILR